MLARASLLVWWLVLGGIVVFHHIKKRMEGQPFVGEFPSVPKIAIPIIITAIIGFLYISFLSIVYIFNPALALELLLPIYYLDTLLMKNIGSALILAGITIIFVAYFNLGSSLRLLLADASESTELKTTGLYSISRNPLYLGFHLSLVGICLIIPTWLTITFAVIFLVNQDFRIRTEEKDLEKRFGNDYVEYKQKVLRYVGRRRK